MVIYFAICFFIFGTIFGSFFQVVGERLPNEQSIVKPSSHCPKCMHKLGPLELIPIFSYLIQKGRCKHCHSKIPKLCPIFEAFSGLLFMLAYLSFDLSLELIISLLFISMLLIIYVSDCAYMIICDEVLIVFTILIGIAKLFINGYTDVFSSLLNGLIAFGFMYLLKLLGNFMFKKESMGDGDIKLMFVFGFVLGWQMAIISIFIGSIVGLPISLYIAMSKKEHIIPFGPFLNTGALIILLLHLDVATILSYLI